MIKFIIGVDEVGKGAGSHQITVCAVRAAVDWTLDGLRDSKKLSAARREAMVVRLEKCFKDCEIFYSIAERSNQFIDQYGIDAAQRECFIEAINKVWIPNSQIIMDGNLKFKKTEMPTTNFISIEKADDKIPTVMAASIIAKVHRDNEVTKTHQLHPQYNWIKNKGYLTKDHREAISKFGYNDFHRKSFKIKS